jgi:hypothetical protein
VLAALVGLQVLESFYQMVPLAVLGIVYGAAVALRHRDRLVALAPKLVVVVGTAAAAAALVVTPYLQVRATWGLAGHQNMFPLLNSYLPGHDRYPGTVLVVLAALGLADRAVRRRRDDPRGPLALAGVLLFLVIVGGAIVPGIGFVASPLRWIVPYLPGLDTVRGLQFGIVGVWLVASLLAAYGVRALTAGRSRPTAIALGAVVAALALAETFVPPIATASFGGPVRQVAAPLPVSDALRGLFDEKLSAGAVLDLPARLPGVAFRERGHRVLLAAFHRHPTTGCFASFDSPLAADVDDLAARLPDRRAADALRALGFASVVVHEEELPGAYATELAARLRQLATGDPRLVELGAADSHRVYAFEGTTPARAELGLLTTTNAPLLVPTQTVAAGVRTITIRFRNSGPGTFVHPDPIVPTVVIERWLDATGTSVAEHRVRMLLPIALAEGDVLDRTIEVTTPPTPGAYRLEVRPADRPETIIAVARIAVRQ